MVPSSSVASRSSTPFSRTVGDWRSARLAEAADEFLLPLERVRGGGMPGARRPPTGRALAVDGAQVVGGSPRPR